MTFDWKHLVAGVIGAALTIGLSLLGTKTGINVQPTLCSPAAAVIAAPAAAPATAQAVK